MTLANQLNLPHPILCREPGHRAGLSLFRRPPMSIPDHACTDFQTLLRAAAAGDLALVECADTATGEPATSSARLVAAMPITC
jgi:hypothetical protein